MHLEISVISEIGFEVVMPFMSASTVFFSVVFMLIIMPMSVMLVFLDPVGFVHGVNLQYGYHSFIFSIPMMVPACPNFSCEDQRHSNEK